MLHELKIERGLSGVYILEGYYTEFPMSASELAAYKHWALQPVMAVSEGFIVDAEGRIHGTDMELGVTTEMSFTDLPFRAEKRNHLRREFIAAFKAWRGNQTA